MAGDSRITRAMCWRRDFVWVCLHGALRRNWRQSGGFICTGQLLRFALGPDLFAESDLPEHR